MTIYYTHISVPYSANINGPQPDISQRGIDLRTLNHVRDVSSKSLPSGCTKQGEEVKQCKH